MARMPIKHGETPLHVVAAELGISANRVRMIEQNAIKKARRWCEARGYTLSDLLPDARCRFDQWAEGDEDEARMRQR